MTHCNTLQHAATHCNTLQHTATLCNTLQRRYSAKETYNFKEPTNRSHPMFKSIFSLMGFRVLDTNFILVNLNSMQAGDVNRWYSNIDSILIDLLSDRESYT